MPQYQMIKKHLMHQYQTTSPTQKRGSQPTKSITSLITTHLWRKHYSDRIFFRNTCPYNNANQQTYNSCLIKLFTNCYNPTEDIQQAFGSLDTDRRSFASFCSVMIDICYFLIRLAIEAIIIPKELKEVA